MQVAKSNLVSQSQAHKSKIKVPAKRSERLYDDKYEKRERLEELERRVNIEVGMTFTPKLVTKDSALSQQTLETIKADLKGKEIQVLDSMDFEQRN